MDIGTAPPKPRPRPRHLRLTPRKAARLAWQSRVTAGNALLRTSLPAQAAEARLHGNAGGHTPDILIAPNPGASRVLISFSGNGDELILHPAMQTLANTHVIAIRDASRRFGLCGLRGLGADYAACLGNLRVLITALGGREIFMMGVSAGGFTAMRMAFDLGAQGVLGFSIPTTLDLADQPGATLARYPQLTALYRNKPDMLLDLRRLYLSAPARPRAILVYSPPYRRDSWLARRMEGMDGVELVPLSAYSGHLAYQWLTRTNQVAGYIARLLALAPVAAG